ncbi:MAG: FHA domain-containing protein [Planctomycetota bacterium]|jgi:S-DNA-T family DNA segregation ATPase FtsK/SpoIIIE
MASLFVVSGKSRGSVITIGSSSMVVGRDEGCDLQVVDELVSRRHFEVRGDDGDGPYRLVDLGSSNGTFIEGEQVSEKELADGDVIVVGESKVLFTTRQFPDDDAAMAFFKMRGQHEKRTMISPREELE